MVAEAAEVRNFRRTFNTTEKAFFWQSPEGRETWFWTYASKRLFETKLDQNPPRAARAYALLGVALFDSWTASQDGKFTYWYIRPPQLDPGITPICFPAKPITSAASEKKRVTPGSGLGFTSPSTI
jgi:hypothetical protein